MHLKYLSATKTNKPTNKISLERYNPKSSLFFFRFSSPFLHTNIFNGLQEHISKSWGSHIMNLLHLLALWFHHLLLNNVWNIFRLLCLPDESCNGFFMFIYTPHLRKAILTATMLLLFNNRKLIINRSGNLLRFTFPKKTRKKHLALAFCQCPCNVCLHGHENTSDYIWRATLLSSTMKCQFLSREAELSAVVLGDLCSCPQLCLCYNFKVSLHLILCFDCVSIVLEINYRWKTSFSINMMFFITI